MKLRPLFTICWVARVSRPCCGPRHTIFHSNIFLDVKSFATIILPWNLLKCILWYSLEFSDQFFRSKFSFVNLKKRETLNKKFTFVPWKWGLFFLKKRNPIFPKRRLCRHISLHLHRSLQKPHYQEQEMYEREKHYFINHNTLHYSSLFLFTLSGWQRLKKKVGKTRRCRCQRWGSDSCWDVWGIWGIYYLNKI